MARSRLTLESEQRLVVTMIAVMPTLLAPFGAALAAEISLRRVVQHLHQRASG